MTLDGDALEKETKFSYLGNVLSSGGMQEVTTGRITSGWKKIYGYSKCIVQKVREVSCVMVPSAGP